VLHTHKKLITVGTSQRSAVASELDAMAMEMACLLELGGAEVDSKSGYPGWQPNIRSPLLDLSLNTYTQLFGKKPAIKAIHAGLECGLISVKFPEVDMISFGPTIEDAHSPDESVEIPSVETFYRYLIHLLQVLARTEARASTESSLN
jgi:dipeptidase D